MLDWRSSTLALATFGAFLLGAVAPSPATAESNQQDDSGPIEQLSGDVHRISKPDSLTLHETEGTDVLALKEPGARLAQSLPLNLSEAGTISGPEDLTSEDVTAGTRVTSVVLHFDPPGSNTQLHASGTVTFDQKVLGIIVTTDELDVSADRVGFDDLKYPSIGDLENNYPDTVTLLPNRREIELDWRARGGIDQARVILSSGSACQGGPTIATEDGDKSGLQFDDCIEITKPKSTEVPASPSGENRSVIHNPMYKRLLDETAYDQTSINALNNTNRLQSISNNPRSPFTYDRFQMTLKLDGRYVAQQGKIEKLRDRYDGGQGIDCSRSTTPSTIQGLFECMAQDIDVVESSKMEEHADFLRCDRTDCSPAYTDWRRESIRYGKPGSMFQIDFDLPPERANVVMTQKRLTRSRGYFLNSTLTDMHDKAVHPVWGSREFGYLIANAPGENGDVYVTFYTSTVNKTRPGALEDIAQGMAKREVKQTWFGLLKGIKDGVQRELGTDPTLITYDSPVGQRVDEELHNDKLAAKSWCEKPRCLPPDVSHAIRYRKWKSGDSSKRPVEAAPYEASEDSKPRPYHHGTYDCEQQDPCVNQIGTPRPQRGFRAFAFPVTYRFTDGENKFPYTECPTGPAVDYQPDKRHCHETSLEAFKNHPHPVEKARGGSPAVRPPRQPAPIGVGSPPSTGW